MKAFLFLLSLLVSGLQLAAQETTDHPFNGLIIDTNGKGLKATIQIKHSPVFTYSDRNGKFGLVRVLPSDTLTIRYKKEQVDIPVEGRNAIRITWLGHETQGSAAPELADYGYGYVKRRNLTQSSSGLSGDDLVKRGFTDLGTAIATLVPGVVQRNGQLIINGGSSLVLSNAALILCDGSPVSNIHMINIQDVETIEVQKNGSLYGSRGANGVIHIRTKKGGRQSQ